jgi:copper homeostasis protein (lipoprotein)
MRTAMALAGMAAVAVLAGCVVRPPAPAEPMMATISGSATYRERIALPPGATLEATLLDVSLADAPAETIATTRQEDIGQPPYAFEISYDPRRIVPSRVYAVRARITLEGRLLFTTDTVHPVLTNGNPSTVDVVLKRVAGAAGRATGGKPGDLYATLPATFTGVLPCADCEGIEYHVDFFKDGAFFLRAGYLGKPDGTSDDIGRYALSTDGVTLVLQGGREAPLYFSIEDADTLRKLDIEGRPIDSTLNYELTRAGTFSSIEPALSMSGMFSYMADAAGFTECLTGKRMPVAMEGGYIDLERAYMAAEVEPPAAVMALVEGRIAQRMPMEGPGPVPTLVVDRFLRLAPGEACPPPFANAPLRDTYWRLTYAGGQAVVPAEDQSEPHIVLRTEEGRVAGSDGCNRLVGGYTVQGDGISFGQMASTMMACPGGTDVAKRLSEALGAASGWRILGRRLELSDAAGRLLARFEAS